MLRVPYGVENNPTSFNNAHVNSWFVDYGHKVIGGTSNYERPISNVDKLGGLSVINHPANTATPAMSFTLPTPITPRIPCITTR